MKTCPNCSKEIEENVITCECGHKFEEKVQQVNVLQNEYESPVLKKRSKKGAAIKAVVLVFCLIAGIVGGFFASLYFSKVRWSEKFDPVLLLEDGMLLCADAARPKAEPILVAEFEGDADDLSFYYEYYMSHDNKQLLYANGYYMDEESYESTYDIYLYDLELQQQQVKVASGVSYFYVNEAFDTVTCLKGEGKDAKLCQYDMMGHETVITKSVQNYNISADGATVIYQTFDDEIYVYTKGDEPVLINKNSTISNVSDDFTRFIYVTNAGALIEYDLAENAKTVIDKGVDSDFYSMNFCNGKGYYTKPTTVYKLSDYFEDDMLESDKNIDYSSDDYDNRLMRDSIRQEIADDEYNTVALSDLYYYNGEKSKLVDTDVWMFYQDDLFKCDGCYYEKAEELRLEKTKMSEIAPLIEEGEIYSFFDYFLGYSTDTVNESYYVCIGAKKSEKLELDGMTAVDGFAYNSEENTVYLYGTDEDTEFTSVYKAAVSGNTVSEFECLSDKIGCNEVYFTESGDCFYLESRDKQADFYDYNSACDLYMNGTLVKENIDSYIEFGVEDWFILQDYEKNSDDEYIYTVLEGDTATVFTCALPIGDVYLERTEKGNYILSDDEEITVIKGEKVKKDVWITEEYFIPKYPTAVIDEMNFDFSDLYDSYEDDLDLYW